MSSRGLNVHWRPYGANLLTVRANTWLIFAVALVFLMAAVEATAWANLGYFVGEGAIRWVAAVLIFVTVFVVVGILDLSLMNLDRAAGQHAKIFFGEAEQGWGWRSQLALSMRIALVLVSLLISAPLLSLLIFRSDINRMITAEAISAIDAKRHEMLAAFNEALKAKDNEIRLKRREYELEVAGKGPSGHYGQGPAAQALLRNVEKLERTESDSFQQGTRARDAFETLASNWRVNRESLAAEYNLHLPVPSVLENRHALEEITGSAAFKHTELAIRALLGFIFAGILLLKLYQPRSVLLYQSEILQEKYLCYLSGAYNSWLPFAKWPSETSFEAAPEGFFQLLLAEVAEKFTKTMNTLETQILGVQGELTTLETESERLEDIHSKALASAQNERVGQSKLAEAAKRANDAWQMAVKRVSSKRTELDDLQKLLREIKSRMRTCLQANAFARLSAATVRA